MGQTPTQPPAPPPAYPVGPPPRQGISGGVVALIVGGVVVVAGAAIAFLLFRDSGTDPPPPPPVSISPLPPPSPVTSPVTPSPPVSPPPSPVEPTGSLSDILVPRVGNFRLLDVAPDPQTAANLGATDALVANYQRSDAVRIIHNVIAFASHTDASIGRETLIAGLRNLGYVEVDQARRGGVNATLFFGPDEIVVWSNGDLVAAAEGPFGVTLGFFNVLPY